MGDNKLLEARHRERDDVMERAIKALFIHGKQDMNLEQAIRIAKEQAERALMGESQFIRIMDTLWSARCEGWIFLVEYKI